MVCRRGNDHLHAFCSMCACGGCPGHPARGGSRSGPGTGQWVKGEAVESLEKGKLYVVEFWATWCGPCRASIPHVSKLQEQYKDITFIGQDCLEEDQALVPPFVEKMGDKMKYRVALDSVGADKKGKMAATWMDAAGRNGIPCAFVIDKETKIAWIGHPMELDGVLKDVEAGTFDPKKHAEAAAARESKGQKLEKAMEAGEFDKALSILDELAKADPDEAKNLGMVRYNILLKKKDGAAALALAKELSETYKDEPQALNELAWSMVDPENPIEKPDLDLARTMALRANEVTKGENAEVLDTLARTYFAKGELDKAIEVQTQAVAKAEEPDLKTHLSETLKTYASKREATPK